ncbi:tetratricopeptide repeat protein [Gimesia maris]|uniref:Anaphase-promoting complex, cyclosome, subunit 3 n=1 Tax=Gimesia maris TaxID=122 RepID=A0ABX5YF50_9PLAN|nr:tetratricopeptide repeat protein [Gimesia maris]QEG14245.1 Anaphase-promoting complex, cyclosome, subunit 3 [Gimesia maris]
MKQQRNLRRRERKSNSLFLAIPALLLLSAGWSIGCSSDSESDQWQTPTEWVLLIAQEDKRVNSRCQLLNDIARAQLAAGEKEQALQTLQPALELIHEAVDIGAENTSIIDTLILLGEVETAVQTAKDFRSPVLTDPAFKAIALELIKTGKISEAVEAVQNLENERSAIRVYESVVESLVQQGQQQQALEFVEQIPQLNHKGAALCALAMVYHKQGDSQKAFELLKPIADWYQKVDDQTVVDRYMTRRDQLMVKLAAAYARGGNSKRALEIANKISVPQSRNAELAKIAEHIARESGDYEQALEIVNQIQISKLQYSTGKFLALMNISTIIARDSGDFEWAMKVADEIKGRESEIAAYRKPALEEIATLAAKTGNEAQTMAVVEKISQMYHLRDRPLSLNNVAFHLVENGHLKSAMKVVEMIQSPEQKKHVWDAIASNYARSGKTEKAIEFAQKNQTKTDHDSALLLVASHLSEAGKSDEALKIATQVPASSRTNSSIKVMVLERIALELLRKGDASKGLMALDEAVSVALESNDGIFPTLGIIPLACEPLTAAQQKEADKDIVTPLKKSFTPEESRVAKRLMKAIPLKSPHPM